MPLSVQMVVQTAVHTDSGRVGVAILVKGAVVRSGTFLRKEFGKTPFKSFAPGPGGFRVRRQSQSVGPFLPRDLAEARARDAIWRKLRQT